jgi:hypothetical protein
MEVKRQSRNDEKAVQLNDVIKKHAPASEGRICAECNMFYKTEVNGLVQKVQRTKKNQKMSDVNSILSKMLKCEIGF